MKKYNLLLLICILTTLSISSFINAITISYGNHNNISNSSLKISAVDYSNATVVSDDMTN